MKQPTKDLFDDSTMTFGEHLEALRLHLIRAILGLIVAVGICLYQGSAIVDFVRQPIDQALKRYAAEYDVTDDLDEMKSGWAKIRKDWGIELLGEMFGGKPPEENTKKVHLTEKGDVRKDIISVQIPAQDLARALHSVYPKQFPEIGEDTQDAVEGAEAASAKQADDAAKPARPPMVAMEIQAPEFAQFQVNVEQSRKPVTLNVPEAFLMYLKVSLVAALILASPWIFYQLWMFVAAGLYPHERHYVYLYGTMSLGLFIVGALFCFKVVFPFVLQFLLSFNALLHVNPQIRLSEWVSFAVMLPLMFGLSFQLPLVMLFLERISIFEVEHYTQQRRLAILVIAIISMVFTPQDPTSMLLMMLPLCILYEVGILLCKHLPSHSPYEQSAA